MTLLIIGLIVFLGIHAVPMNPAWKESAIARIGRRGYQIGFAVASTIGLILIVVGFARLRGSPQDVQLWSPPPWSRHVAFALMLAAFILLVAAYVPSRIRDVAGGHPMLLSIIVWALAHLIANGNLAGLLLFGAFLVWAVADRLSAGGRAALGPLGRKPGTLRGDIIAVVVGVALYALILKWGHPLITGITLVS
jgi:uncharacterized membrane protein